MRTRSQERYTTENPYEAQNTRECRDLKEFIRRNEVRKAVRRLEKSLEEYLNRKVRIDQEGKQIKVSGATLANYRAGIKLLLLWTGESGEDLFKPSDSFGQRFLEYLKATYPDSPATVATRLTYAHTLFRILHLQGCANPEKCNPFKEIST